MLAVYKTLSQLNNADVNVKSYLCRDLVVPQELTQNVDIAQAIALHTILLNERCLLDNECD